MAVTQKTKPSEAKPSENSLALELGRIAKLFALYLLKDTKDEGAKVTRLDAVGFTVAEIASLLGKTELNVRVQLSQARARRGKAK